MLISVIVPVYNTKQYLSICLDSILNQTYKNIEVILVDDGSTDGSLEICMNYADTDSRIIVVQQEHRGLVEARKSGVKTSKGEYCIFVDSDDWIADNLVETVLSLADSGSVDIVNYNMRSVGSGCSDWTYTVPEGAYEYLQLEDVYKKMMFDFENGCSGIIQSLCTKFMRRNLLWSSIENEDPRITMGEDAAVVYKALLMAKKVVVTHKVFYFYRIHEKSMCRKKENDTIIRVHYFQQYMQSIFSAYNKTYELNRQLQRYIVPFIRKGITDLFSLEIHSLYRIPFCILADCINRRIVLYGAGVVGKSYYRQLTSIQDMRLAAWVDRKLGGQKIYDCEIEFPEALKDIDFDRIIIAVKNQDIAAEIKKSLEKDFGEDRVMCIDAETDWREWELDIY